MFTDGKNYYIKFGRSFIETLIDSSLQSILSLKHDSDASVPQQKRLAAEYTLLRLVNAFRNPQIILEEEVSKFEEVFGGNDGNQT